MGAPGPDFGTWEPGTRCTKLCGQNTIRQDGLAAVLLRAGRAERRGGSGDVIDPYLVHGRIALVVERPLACAQVEATAAGGRGHPHVPTLHRNAVHSIVAQAR